MTDHLLRIIYGGCDGMRCRGVGPVFVGWGIGSGDAALQMEKSGYEPGGQGEDGGDPVSREWRRGPAFFIVSVSAGFV